MTGEGGAVVLVATPIGNLGDLAPRAVGVLRAAHLVCCEDTRRTRVLLTAAGIGGGGRLRSLHAHNESARIAEVLAALSQGATVAVVSDAGMPGVSDPGQRLVAAVTDAGWDVTVVPGPSAVLAALVVSGLATDRFCSEGFLPRKGEARRRRLDALMTDERTAVVLEAPGRLAGTLAEVAERAPDRRVAVCRELTKVHEEVWRGTAAGAAEEFSGREVRGEVVLVVAGTPAGGRGGVGPDDAAVAAAVAARVAEGDSAKDAAAAVAGALGVSRRRAYAAAVDARRERPRAGARRGRPRAGARRERPRAGAGTLPPVPRFYVTTPIYYVNDAPHVGTAYTTVNADALARWHRLRGEEVFFLTGTDEHGAKMAEAAAEHGMTPKAWADTVVQRFVDAWHALDVANDDFIRTTEPRHHTTVQALLQRIYDNGYIRLDTYRGLYCISCEDYYTADQLVDGNCPVHGRPVVEMDEENYFFELSRFEDRLIEWYDSQPEAVRPATKRNEALTFIKGGLRDISITRTSLRWGVPVPWDSGHVFYVWYDALINYLTAIGYGNDNERFGAWWPAVHHLIGKEILRFHCVWWPAMCMAAGIDPPANVFVHGWLLLGGQKLSKSLLRTAAGAEATRLTDIAPEALVADFGVDATRYHLLRDVPLGTDGDFSYEGIVARYNADLANNLGNLVARVATVVGTKCRGVGPSPDPGSELSALAAEVVASVTDAWQRFAPHEALAETWRLIGAANAALEASEPWKAEPGPAVDAVLGDALEVLRIVSLLVSPAMPRAAAEIWRRVGLDGSPADQEVPAAAAWGGYPGGLVVEKGAPLFPRRKVEA